MTRRHALIPAALALLAIPATASAHDATIACDASAPNGYRVVADYTWLNPVTTFGPTSATVVWSDRYRVVLPYPTGCVVPPPVVPPVVPPPPPAPEQPVTPVVPVVGSQPAPPVVTPGEPEPMPTVRPPRKPLKATKSVRTLRSIACTRAGQRSASIVRIRVVWSRGGVVVKTKQRTFRKPGVVCHYEVTG